LEYIVICTVAFMAAILTFFSGFGLGTLLAPVFMLFFPVDLAIAMTGVVHFLNNIFKLFLVAGHANRSVLLRFGIPAVIAAFAGATVLINIPDQQALYEYTAGQKNYAVTPLELTIGILLFFFALLELIPYFRKLQFGSSKLVIGGLLSGFFGGLSGHQGALRSAFLIKAGLSKEAFIGTAVVVSSFVDFTRISVYLNRMIETDIVAQWPLLLSAVLSAITGALIGNKLLKKITLSFLHLFVGFMLMLIALALITGVL